MLKSTKVMRLSLIFYLVIFAQITSATACLKPRRPEIHLIPEDYVGWVRIEFGVETAPALPIENDNYVIKIPSTGRLQTSTTFEEGWAEDKFYYYSKSGDIKRQLYETDSGGSGMIWAGNTGSKQEVSGIHKCYFIGTERDLKDYGWSSKNKICDP